jgi:hypothetical protein
MAETSIPLAAGPIPGATYSCELLTVTESGMKVSADSGSYYPVTMPQVEEGRRSTNSPVYPLSTQMCRKK